MYTQLAEYIKECEQAVADIPGERKDKLEDIAGFIRDRLGESKPASLIFICTHNSRRSHLCQIWAAVAAHRAGLEDVQTFSGGTEATALNPRAAQAIERAGFRIMKPGGNNPRYQVHFSDKTEPLICFSKIFDNPHNPQKDFAAVMTCSDADQNCPFVPGTSFRASIPYVDPKEADGTPQESQTYDERCRQIATEMIYMISQVE